MNLTNKNLAEEDGSLEFNFYIPKNQKLDLFPYELSGSSETQLLDPSVAHQNSSFCISSQESFRKPFVLQVDPNNSQLCDLADEFQITNEPSDIKAKKVHYKHAKVSMQEICEDLMGIIKSLQEKLGKFEDNSPKGKQNIRQSSTSSETNSQKSYINSISQLTSSTGLKFSTQNQLKKQNSELPQLLIQLIQTKGQIKIYKEQNQKLCAELIKFKVINEQQTNTLKKQEAELHKMRQILKQYRNYHRHKLQKESQQNLDNSLDRRLRTCQSQNKMYVKGFKDLNFKQTPKTPNNFTYHQYKSMFNSQKTKQRINVGREVNFIKKLEEFSSRAENIKKVGKKDIQFGNLQKKERQSGDQEFYQKYPFNELLELDGFIPQKNQSQNCKLDYLQTMESLPEFSRTKQEDMNLSTLVLKKYVPSSPY